MLKLKPLLFASKFSYAFRRLSLRGSINVDLITTKTRFTVLLTIAAHGPQELRCLSGFKKRSKLRIPDNITVNVNESGSMNKHRLSKKSG